MSDKVFSRDSDTAETNDPLQTVTRDESRKHFDGLDGLRGIAIVLVLAHHFFDGATSPNPVATVFLNACRAGWCGVDLFFVLSGFLITGILYDTKQDPNFFGKFYMRRFLRIFPLYYAVLFTVFVVLPLLRLDFGSNFSEQRADQGWLWSYTVNLVMAYREQTGFGWFNHFWTLAIEEQFYLIWPLAVFLCRRRQLLGIAIAGSAFAAALRLFVVLEGGHRITAYVFTFCRADSLLLGAALALLAHSGKSWKRCVQWSAPVAMACAAMLFFIFFAQGGLKTLSPIVQTAGYSLLAILSCALVVIAVRGNGNRCLRAPWLRFFGKYSYGLYVFHFLLMPFFYRYFPAKFFADALHSVTAAYCVFAVFGTTISVIVAWVSWHLYEKRFLRLKRRYAYRTFTRQAPGPDFA